MNSDALPLTLRRLLDVLKATFIVALSRANFSPAPF
jgi:hypothetical protein